MLKRILVLDDNEDILDIVHEALSYAQFEVVSVSDGCKLMSVMEEFNPDLVLLDYLLSGVNGGEICRQIKAHPKYNNVPVILFSAYISHERDLMAYGCDAVISKPFDLFELIDTVNNLIC